MMAVTGWRMSFLCTNEEVMDTLIKMQYQVCASPSMSAMYGILAALLHTGPYLDNARRVFRNRRDLITRMINEILSMHPDAPHEAFYAFLSYDKDIPSAELDDKITRNGLICTPGFAFGKYREGHLRFSYTVVEAKINAGMDILSNVITEAR